MQTAKYILGALLSLYAIAQLVRLVMMVLSGEPPSGQFAVSVWGASIAAVTIPAALALLMFRKPKQK
jgi:hypothetical protein